MLQLGKTLPYVIKLCRFRRFHSSKKITYLGFCGLRAYDRAAIKFRGLDADINFNLSDYEDDLKQVRCFA